MMLRTAQTARCDTSPTNRPATSTQPSNNDACLGIPRPLRNRPSSCWPTTRLRTAHPFCFAHRNSPSSTSLARLQQARTPKHTTTRSQPGRRRRETQLPGSLTPLFRPPRGFSGERLPIEQSHPRDKHHSRPSSSGGGQRATATAPRRGTALRLPSTTITPLIVAHPPVIHLEEPLWHLRPAHLSLAIPREFGTYSWLAIRPSLLSLAPGRSVHLFQQTTSEPQSASSIRFHLRSAPQTQKPRIRASVLRHTERTPSHTTASHEPRNFASCPGARSHHHT